MHPLAANFDLNYVNNTVFESLVHSDLRRIQLYENWFLWLGGLVYEPLSRTQVPQRIVSGGAGLCSEVVAVVNRIAGLNNVDARIVALNGHVVSEVLTDHGWQIADPDYGVSFAYNLEALESGAIDDLVRDKLQQVGYGEHVIASYQEFFKTKDNVTLEIGAPSSPRLYQIEILSEWLKWMIPVFLIAAGIAAMRIRKV